MPFPNATTSSWNYTCSKDTECTDTPNVTWNISVVAEVFFFFMFFVWVHHGHLTIAVQPTCTVCAYVLTLLSLGSCTRTLVALSASKEEADCYCAHSPDWTFKNRFWVASTIQFITLPRSNFRAIVEMRFLRHHCQRPTCSELPIPVLTLSLLFSN